MPEKAPPLPDARDDIARLKIPAAIETVLSKLPMGEKLVSHYRSFARTKSIDAVKAFSHFCFRTREEKST